MRLCDAGACVDVVFELDANRMERHERIAVEIKKIYENRYNFRKKELIIIQKHGKITRPALIFPKHRINKDLKNYRKKIKKR